MNVHSDSASAVDKLLPLMVKISEEPNDNVRLFGAHYLRWLRGLTKSMPRSAAYQISTADSRRVRTYIDEEWEALRGGRRD